MLSEAWHVLHPTCVWACNGMGSIVLPFTGYALRDSHRKNAITMKQQMTNGCVIQMK